MATTLSQKIVNKVANKIYKNDKKFTELHQYSLKHEDKYCGLGFLYKEVFKSEPILYTATTLITCIPTKVSAKTHQKIENLILSIPILNDRGENKTKRDKQRRSKRVANHLRKIAKLLP